MPAGHEGSGLCYGGVRRNQPVCRDRNALRHRFVRILKKDHATVRFRIIRLNDAGTGRFMSCIQHDDGLSGCEFHTRKIRLYGHHLISNYEHAVHNQTNTSLILSDLK